MPTRASGMTFQNVGIVNDRIFIIVFPRTDLLTSLLPPHLLGGGLSVRAKDEMLQILCLRCRWSHHRDRGFSGTLMRCFCVGLLCGVIAGAAVRLGRDSTLVDDVVFCRIRDSTRSHLTPLILQPARHATRGNILMVWTLLPHLSPRQLHVIR